MNESNPLVKQKIRVLLVDDSPVALLLLRRALAQDAQIAVVGTARDGAEALRMVHELKPDVVSTDLHMPIMDGLELTRRIMAESPRPVLVCSTSVQTDDSLTVFELLQAGALDVFPKPRTGLEGSDLAEMIRKIKILSGVKVFRTHGRVPRFPAPDAGAQKPKHIPKIVVIGASTGGPRALQSIFQILPADFPVPILCVQHISAEFATGMVTWLANQSHLKMRFAQAGEPLRAGTVYFPPPGHDLLVSNLGDVKIRSLDADAVSPSVDVTMESVAKIYRAGAIGVLLTGMGSDGAKSMLLINQAGGITIAQNAETSVVFGMSERAIALGGVQRVLPLDEIAPALMRLAVPSQK